MIQVATLTETQKDLLLDQKYNEDSYFNPLQDCNGVWFISTEEINNCIYPQFNWIQTLPLINFCGYFPIVSGSTIN
jgi:hypothetical protein